MGRIPPWYKGQMRECAICGFWYEERDFRMKRRDNKWVCKWDYDTLTDLEREEAIRRTR